MAALLEFSPQALEVVDLAVHRDGDPACLVADRLRAAGHIDDRKAAEAERDPPGLDEPPLVIGPPVLDRSAHACERIVVEVRASRPSGDAAHRQEGSERLDASEGRGLSWAEHRPRHPAGHGLHWRAMDAPTTLAQPRQATRASVLHRVMAFIRAHPVWAIFLLALALRVCVAVGIALVHPQNIAPDGVEYSALAAAKASGHTAGWGSYEHFLWHVTLTLLLPLTWLYEVFGIHQLVGQLYVALLGAGTAAVTTRLAMEALPRRWSLAAGLIVALLPTQIVWSSLILKDSSVWFLLTCLALTVAVAGRSSGPRLIALGLAAAALLVLLGYLREYTLVIAAWALMLAVLVGPRTHRLPQIAGAVVIAVFIPWAVFGMGPAGLTYVKGSPAPSDIRAGMAVDASSAVPGAASAGGGTGADISYLPQGVTVMLFQPYPWQVTGSTYLRAAQPTRSSGTRSCCWRCLGSSACGYVTSA